MRDVTRLFFDKHFGAVSDSVMDTFIETYISEWNRGIILYPEMKSFLNRLRKNYKLSVISNTHYPSLVHRNLEAMGVSDYFDLVMTSVEYGIPKPDSRIFHETLNRLHVSAHEIVHIGDSHNDDYMGAVTAGIRCILLDPDHKWDGEVKEKVDSIFDIEKLL
jgi:putative hydrolase of the HAD superfamily